MVAGCPRTYLSCHVIKVQQLEPYSTANRGQRRGRVTVGQCQGLYLFRLGIIISSLIDEPIGLLVSPPCDMIFEKTCPAPLAAARSHPQPMALLAKPLDTVPIHQAPSRMSQTPTNFRAALASVAYPPPYASACTTAFCRAISAGAYERA